MKKMYYIPKYIWRSGKIKDEHLNFLNGKQLSVLKKIK